ncbi:MAG: TetR family transcriptional regulator [Microbacteriaceae bacterium]
MNDSGDAGAKRARGRPRKSPDRTDDPRSHIVAAAARAFAQHGYEATSIRSIARDAGVDPGLVRHYFIDKPGLFAESLQLPARPDRAVRAIVSGPRENIGENLVRFLVTTLDEPIARSRVLRIIHTALGQEFAATLLRQFLQKEVLTRIVSGIDDDDAALRASLIASQIVGLIVARYGIRIEPLASASPDVIVSRIGAVIQAHLDDSLDKGSVPSE